VAESAQRGSFRNLSRNWKIFYACLIIGLAYLGINFIVQVIIHPLRLGQLTSGEYVELGFLVMPLVIGILDHFESSWFNKRVNQLMAQNPDYESQVKTEAIRVVKSRIPQLTSMYEQLIEKNFRTIMEAETSDFARQLGEDANPPLQLKSFKRRLAWQVTQDCYAAALPLLKVIKKIRWQDGIKFKETPSEVLVEVIDNFEQGLPSENEGENPQFP